MADLGRRVENEEVFDDRNLKRFLLDDDNPGYFSVGETKFLSFLFVLHWT